MDLAAIFEKAKTDKDFRKSLVVWAKDTEEGKEILTNFANTEFERRFGEDSKEMLKKMSDDAFEILGVRKPEEKEVADFFKDLFTQLKDLKGKTNESQEQVIKDLKQKLKDAQESGTINEHWKGVYDKAVEDWKEKEKGLNEEISTLQGDATRKDVKYDLDKARGELTFIEGVPQKAIDALAKQELDIVMKNAKIIDGKVVYHNPDGTPWMNNEYKPITAGEIMQGILGDVIDANNPSGRSGGGGAPTKVGEGKIIKVTEEGGKSKSKLVLDKSSFSTQVEFTKASEKALRSQGIEAGQKEFNELKDAAYMEYGVSELPLQ